MLLRFGKLARALWRKLDALVGRLYSLDRTLEAMAARPFELHLELTNQCNANCIFCPYSFQERAIATMSDRVFEKALSDYVSQGGGSVLFTPIVGDALIDKRFLQRVHKARSYPEIDRITVITNAILAHRYGARKLIQSGLTQITISTAGFNEEMYQRVYRSKMYKQMRRNVIDLLEENRVAGGQVNIVIALRPDRSLEEVLEDADFQDILAYKPLIDFTWNYTSAGGRITRNMLSPQMRLRELRRKKESCVQLYNGPIVLPDGTVLACSCVAAMDAVNDLAIGNVLDSSLIEIWRSDRLRRIRSSFGTNDINVTCSKCDMYRNLELYRTREGRDRAQINRRRLSGEAVRRGPANLPFTGG